jgi:hypothetical protein
MEDKNFSEENKIRKAEKDQFEKDEHVKEAFDEAENDIEKDPDFKPDENEDLDEGELARKEGHP